jgi:tellurite resistance protein TerA
VDNGDNKEGNDDLDLRCGLLLPSKTVEAPQKNWFNLGPSKGANDKMELIAPNMVGSYTKFPFVHHLGDVKNASRSAPGKETMEINPEISNKIDGPCALVFSVYSAVSNGVVSIASLRPVMEIKYGNEIVRCSFDFSSGPNARNSCIYTYCLGIVYIDGANVTISPSGVVSKPGSEATPRLSWNNDGTVRLTMDGPQNVK